MGFGGGVCSGKSSLGARSTRSVAAGASAAAAPRLPPHGCRQEAQFTGRWDETGRGTDRSTVAFRRCIAHTGAAGGSHSRRVARAVMARATPPTRIVFRGILGLQPGLATTGARRGRPHGALSAPRAVPPVVAPIYCSDPHDRSQPRERAATLTPLWELFLSAAAGCAPSNGLPRRPLPALLSPLLPPPQFLFSCRDRSVR